MVFGFWKRKKREERPADPLAVFDQLIEDLERQGAEIRKSAATLLALRGDLSRSAERYSRRLEDISSRRAIAAARGDARSEAVLERDRAQAQALLESSRESLERAEQDSRLLLEAASDVAARVLELRTERESASARLTAGGMVTQALRDQVQRFEKVLALEAARDEIERAHALADIYREERGEKAG
jgi:phage shock protein A